MSSLRSIAAISILLGVPLGCLLAVIYEILLGLGVVR